MYLTSYLRICKGGKGKLPGICPSSPDLVHPVQNQSYFLPSELCSVIQQKMTFNARSSIHFETCAEQIQHGDRICKTTPARKAVDNFSLLSMLLDTVVQYDPLCTNKGTTCTGLLSAVLNRTTNIRSGDLRKTSNNFLRRKRNTNQQEKFGASIASKIVDKRHVDKLKRSKTQPSDTKIKPVIQLSSTRISIACSFLQKPIAPDDQ